MDVKPTVQILKLEVKETDKFGTLSQKLVYSQRKCPEFAIKWIFEVPQTQQQISQSNFSSTYISFEYNSTFT